MRTGTVIALAGGAALAWWMFSASRNGGRLAGLDGSRRRRRPRHRAPGAEAALEYGWGGTPVPVPQSLGTGTPLPGWAPPVRRVVPVSRAIGIEEANRALEGRRR